MLYYAGIGSRKTPPDVLSLMERIGARLGSVGYTLRTGGADGADDAFIKGAMGVKAPCNIYVPWNGFNGYYTTTKGVIVPDLDELYDIAKIHHPNWNACSIGARKLHARNVCQIKGTPEETKLSSFVVCYTDNGQIKGGTGTAIRLAITLGIRVYNLGIDEVRREVETILQGRD